MTLCCKVTLLVNDFDTTTGEEIARVELDGFERFDQKLFTSSVIFGCGLGVNV
jgi:hypothetical protein